MSSRPKPTELLERIRKRRAELNTSEQESKARKVENADQGHNSSDTTSGPKVAPTELLARIRQRKNELAQENLSATKVSNPYVSDQPTKRIIPPSLGFREPGWYQRQANNKRALDSLRPWERLVLPEFPPEQEWWDMDPTPITARICHPIEIEPPYELLKANGPLEVPLTAEQVRKMRRKRRFFRQREAQDRIRLGLDPPPPPKLKVSNVAAVYGVEYLRDPTRYESLAREAELQRRQRHEATNESRQLSKDQRWLKEQRSIMRHREMGIFCALFKLISVDSKCRFLLDASAKKLALCGVALIISDTDWSLVIIEGGEREVRKYSALVSKHLSGFLLWTGQLKISKFKRWSIHDKLLDDAWEFMRGKNAQAYMNLCIDSGNI